MTTDNQVEPGDPVPNEAASSSVSSGDIVSVNKKGSSENKVAKGLFILITGAMLVGALAWFSQNWLNSRKSEMKANSGPRSAEDTAQVFNPEKTGTAAPKPKLGADSGVPAPSVAASANTTRAAGTRDDGIRPLRGSDGKVLVDAQGRAMGIDKDGNVVTVPAIAAMLDDPAGRKPLPGQSSDKQAQAQGGTPPPSRYGGALFVGEPPKGQGAAEGSSTSSNPAGTVGASQAERQAQQVADILRAAGLGGGRSGPAPGTPGVGAPGVGPVGGGAPSSESRPGTVGSSLYSSATPVAFAKRMTDQNLILPKGRQADCILTGRIVDEVPGFTSCVLAQNMYSDNGRVLLLERGSELTGEYGVTNQLGNERLFVTWTRLKTPEGIEVELSSPGSDRLGTSGLPGHLDNRWVSRIGAAFLLSFVKDITVAVINSQTKSDTSGGTSVSVQTAPGQNTINASSTLAEEVIKQTIKIRPRLTINEGDRISIYVARDLDFSPVYALKSAATTGVVAPLVK